jgi:FAD/FMN-containing dehydrogenase/Fe-S oxidoreductase
MPLSAVQIDELHADLKLHFRSDALTDAVSRGLYATDASVWQFEPLAVITPRHDDDVRKALWLARKYHVPVLPRGGGTSLAGQTANHAIVLDFSKFMNRILAVNEKERWARVQPGIVRDELNAQIASTGLHFAPETATSNRANVGGMFANNSSGAHSVRFGRTMEHVLEARAMLWSGDIVDLAPRTRDEIDELIRKETPEGRLWEKFLPLIEENRQLVEQRFPKVLRRVGGYSLDEFPPGKPWNFTKLLCGSEGTLAVVLDLKVALTETPKHVVVMALHFADLEEGLRAVPSILESDPLAIELLDQQMIRLSRENASTREFTRQIQGDPGVVLITELTADSPEGLAPACDALEQRLKADGRGYAYPRMFDPREQWELMELRRRGLGVALSVPGDIKPVSWIEDACVPPEHLAGYTMKVLDVIKSFNLDHVMYGHASVGVLHIKPALNLKDPVHIDAMAKISHAAMELCRSYGGSWSGEHGDGVARGAQNRDFWGEEMYQVFLDVKKIFDPENLLNPGRIVNSPPVNQNLRYGAKYRVKAPDTFFRFADFGGFAPAVEMCNGVGACRKTLSGTMCPSYMATRDEEATTRGRANALRLAMSGQLGDIGIASEEIHHALDLCLECKACKSECPSNVDMARMKSEHLAHYHDEHGIKLRERIFAEAPVMGRLLSGPIAYLANAPLQVPTLRRTMLGLLGVAKQRHLPAYATQSFESWWRKRTRPTPRDGATEVLLFVDCWANYHETNVAKAAVRVLESLGYRVRISAGRCCQRTRISKGFLDKARKEGGETVAHLDRYARRNMPILGLEPSCTSSLTDDLPDLVKNRKAAKRVAAVTMPIEEFLHREVAEGRLTLPTPSAESNPVLLHGHCHQKAVFSTAAAKALLGPTVTEVDSGCCGMAGSFGYEAEHYEVSQRIGERRLLPAVRSASEDTVVVASGFSCRHQISDATSRKALHVIEALERVLVK